MAIYHIHIKSFSRAKGESSIAAAAYRAGLDLVDTRTRVVHRYSARKGVAGFHMLAPTDAPAWALDPHAFWDANEAAETRSNARVAREVETSLPHELTEAQREALALELGQWLVNRYRCVVLAALHTPSGQGDNRNHHVHFLLSAREVGPSGLEGRAGAAFEARSGGGAAEVKLVREAVARIINAHLSMAGLADRVDHRTLKAQAMDAEARGETEKAAELRRLPTRHHGKEAIALARKAAQAQDTAAWDTAVEKAKAAGTFIDCPEGHSHEAALSDRLLASRPDPRDPEAFRSAWAGEAGWRPREWADLQPSPMARHLSRIAHLGRMRNDEGKALDSVRDLVDAWLRSLHDQVQAAVVKVRQFVAEPAEAFANATKAVLVQRVQIHGTKRHFFEDTEFFVRLLVDYARALVSPRIKEQRLRRAMDQVSVVRTLTGTQSSEFLAASRLLWKAKRSTTSQARERDRLRTNAALRALDETREHYEKTYFVNFPTPIVNEPIEQVGSVDSGEGSSEASRMALRPPMTSGHRTRPRMH